MDHPLPFKKNLALWITLLLLLLPSLGSAATPIPAPPKVAATGHLLLDFHNGQVLSEKNADTRLEPASLTKIMTAYVVLSEIRNGNASLEDQVTVSEKAWRMEGSRMFIEVGTRVKLEDLLHGLIIQSGNDASVALAEHIAASESGFASLMNAQAERLGMTNTHFENATGLPSENHYTTARDIARVAAATIREFPQIYAWYSIKEFTYNNIKQYNRNKLLWRDKSVDGMKTGHTESAGYCLVASAKRGDMRLLSVVMGTKSENARANESQSLLNYGFRFYESHRLYQAGETISQFRVWKGDREQLPVGMKQDLVVTIPVRQYDRLKAKMTVARQIVAPVKKGLQVGTVHITLEGEPVAEVPLVALQPVETGGIWQRTSDAVLLWFE
jgi:D-alanyl-D-alanine carboxypeptidase (penicillin-binding protein 5/6)